VDPLEKTRDDARAQVAALTAARDEIVAASEGSNADDEHDPEGATIAFERSQIGALVRQVELHLAEIDAAVVRVNLGTYGTCERCGKPIGEERLTARPVARTCIACATGPT
jgi:RNA polymerase-binding transcription factor DksA